MHPRPYDAPRPAEREDLKVRTVHRSRPWRFKEGSTLLCLSHITSFISTSIVTATLVSYGPLNYRCVFSAGRFLQSAVASGTSNPQLGGPVIRTFQLPPPGVPHVWNDASEPQQRKVERAGNFAESGDFHVTFGFFYTGPTALLPLRRKACWGFFRLKNPTPSVGFEPANSGTRDQHAYL